MGGGLPGPIRDSLITFSLQVPTHPYVNVLSSFPPSWVTPLPLTTTLLLDVIIIIFFPSLSLFSYLRSESAVSSLYYHYRFTSFPLYLSLFFLSSTIISHSFLNRLFSCRLCFYSPRVRSFMVLFHCHRAFLLS